MPCERHDVTSFDGTRLTADVGGAADAPVVVLVAGLGLTAASWNQVGELLAARRRVISYDMRGNGRSGRASGGGYGLWAHVRDLDAVLAALVPGGRRATVAGHSFGGGVLTAHARRCGTARLAGAVLVGSSASAITLPGTRGPTWLRPAATAIWLAGLRAAAHATRRLRSAERVADAVVRAVTFAPDDPPSAVRTAREQFMGTRTWPLARTALASGAHDGTEMAPALDVPTLVVRGARDRQVSEGDVRRLLELLPCGSAHEIPGAAHNLPFSHPREVADQLLRWSAPGAAAAAAASTRRARPSP